MYHSFQALKRIEHLYAKIRRDVDRPELCLFPKIYERRDRKHANVLRRYFCEENIVGLKNTQRT